MVKKQMTSVTYQWLLVSRGNVKDDQGDGKLLVIVVNKYRLYRLTAEIFAFISAAFFIRTVFNSFNERKTWQFRAVAVAAWSFTIPSFHVSYKIQIQRL